MRRTWKRVRSGKKRKATSPPKVERARDTSRTSDGASVANLLAQKRESHQKKCNEECAILTEKIQNMELELNGLGSERMHMLRRRLTEKKLSVARERLEEITSGKDMREFDRKMASFQRVQREIDRKLAHNPGFAREQPPKNNKRYKSAPRKSNRRKTASHNRDVRVSSGRENDTCYDVLMDEILEEFGGENETKTPEGSSSAEPLPIIYVCNRQFCPDCPDTLLQKLPQESCLSCPKCGVMTSYLDSTAAATGHSDDRSFNQFAYCRTNHFTQWLRCVQGKESVNIPPLLLQGICEELRKKRVKPNEITSKKVRECLKIMRKARYYENVVLITSLLTGKEPPRFTPQVEETLQRLFQKIQKPFDIAVAAIQPDRKNFLSYSFILTKLCGLLKGSVDKRWLASWPTLKGRTSCSKATASGPTSARSSTGSFTRAFNSRCVAGRQLVHF